MIFEFLKATLVMSILLGLLNLWKISTLNTEDKVFYVKSAK
jgi:hypothetical protein